VIGPLWVVIALGVIVPRVSEGDFITQIYSYGVLGNSVGEVIWTGLTNPLLVFQTIATPPKLAFVATLLGLQGFLALLSPIAILALPVLLMNLIAPNAVQFSLNYQYPALIYPFLIVAAAEGLVRLAGWIGRAPQTRKLIISIGMTLLLVIAFGANIYLNNVVLSLARNHEPPARVADAQAIIAQVPPEAALAASSFLAPHLAQREQLYFFPGNKSYPLRYVEERAAYLVADRRPPSGNRQERELLADFLRRPDWELIGQQGDFVLLRRRGNVQTP
jgi:uncharacterized membrane protein